MEFKDYINICTIIICIITIIMNVITNRKIKGKI